MSKVQPSQFLQLFKRGRYVSIRSLAAAEADEGKREKKHEERERFSVAAIAFCLKYDKRFKAQFLRAIAPRVSPEDIAEVRLEPEHWGDLILQGPRHVLVLEFKLGALLQDHQSPEARIFSETGYGAKIRKHFRKEKSGKELRYVVVGKEFKRCNRDGLPCSAVPWGKLLIHDRHESRLEQDLYDCLGYLGAFVFLNRHMKNPKLTDDAKSAMKVYSTLQQVLAETLGIDTGYSESNGQCLGLNIPRAGARAGTLHARLVNVLQTKKRSLGWIGYEVVEDDGLPCLSVWFYSTAKTALVIRQRLEAVKGSVRKSNNEDIYVHLPGRESTNDSEWFQKVLRAAAGP